MPVKPLKTLKAVADRAQVPLLMAYHALSADIPVDARTRQTVHEVAEALGYKLNVTIRDVADQAGVSIATVSYVVNNSAPVSDTTRRRVIDAIEALGYRPNITARNLKASETRMIGYGWHNLQPSGQTNPIMDRFIYQMITTVETHNYHILTFSQDPANPARAYEELIYTNRVDGFILSDTNRNDPRIKRLLTLKFPFISFGRANDDWRFPYVDVDGRRGLAIVTEHLLERGHRRIAVIGWPEGSLVGDARLNGYLDALQGAGISPRPAWIARSINDVHHATEAAHGLMNLPLPERPTAIACLTDEIAIGVMNYLESIGLQVGVDVAVTGFDDVPMSAFLRPPLTTMHQPIDALALQLVDLLIAQLNAENGESAKKTSQSLIPSQLWVVPELIIRASSAAYHHE
jgi:DNA-binding LacI/PurR family transcriptional regulator